MPKAIISSKVDMVDCINRNAKKLSAVQEMFQGNDCSLTGVDAPQGIVFILEDIIKDLRKVIH